MHLFVVFLYCDIFIVVASSTQKPVRTRSKTVDSGEEEDDDEDDDDDEEYKPSDGSDNEMETEIADYM